MTRFGVRYLLQKYVTAGTNAAPTLAGKRIHPNSLRHTTAIHLLKAGIDFATISQWLGHASLNTTIGYARADIDLKRQAWRRSFPKCWHRQRAAPSSSAATTSPAGFDGSNHYVERLAEQSAENIAKPGLKGGRST
jgi:integrase/recombinase XerD